MADYRLDYEKNARWIENNPEKPGDIVDCPFCDATGECPYCLPKDGHDCFKCGFTRKCVWCKGSGKLKVKEIIDNWSYFEASG